MCTSRSFKPKSLNDDSVKTYSKLKAMGKGYDSLPKGGATATGKKKEKYDNQVSNIKANAKVIRSGLRIPTKNIYDMAGNQLPV
jgi:hypothetical protein